MKPVTREGQEPVWTMGPGRTATLKLLSEQSGEKAMMFEEIAPAGAGTDSHLHHGSDEIMYVLDGDFTFRVGEIVTSGGAGTCVFMPRGIAHAWKNTGGRVGRVLIMYTPAQAGKVFEEMAQEQREWSSNDQELVQKLRRYGWEIIGPDPF